MTKKKKIKLEKSKILEQREGRWTKNQRKTINV